ncbi:MAG: hypothetical protein K2W80_17395, partial [Burkholderiales bacterium]|nr:hypothetical protein [Burkholderiales bacterium]
VAPLLQENVAISRYLQATDRISLRSALPEIVTVSEAVGLAGMEYNLTAKQEESLRTLLAGSWQP